MDNIKRGDYEHSGMQDDFDTLRCLELSKHKGVRDLTSFAYHNLDSTTWLNQIQIAEQSSASTSAVKRHLETVVSLGIFESRDEDSTITLYRPNSGSMVMAALVQVELAIRATQISRENNNE